MKIVRSSEAKEFKNSDSCTAIEYPLNDKDINAAIIKLQGRYPDKGRVVNEACKEIAYIIEGSGKVVIEGTELQLEAGDMVLLEPNERYYWEGALTFITPCIPAWYSEQHKEVE